MMKGDSKGENCNGEVIRDEYSSNSATDNASPRMGCPKGINPEIITRYY